MGRSILYVLGLGSIGRVRDDCQYDDSRGKWRDGPPIMKRRCGCLCNDPIVLNVVREMVKTSYLDEGTSRCLQRGKHFLFNRKPIRLRCGC